jgi:hypothetical protein
MGSKNKTNVSRANVVLTAGNKGTGDLLPANPAFARIPSCGAGKLIGNKKEIEKYV